MRRLRSSEEIEASQMFPPHVQVRKMRIVLTSAVGFCGKKCLFV